MLAFKQSRYSRVDNPFLSLSADLSDQISGRDMDTLRAYTAQAHLDAPRDPANGWIAFEIEGHKFRTRRTRGNFYHVEIING